MKLLLSCLFSLLLIPIPLQAEGDPFAPYLTGIAPKILRELPADDTPAEGVELRRVVFESRPGAEMYAVIATPKLPGDQKRPGILVLHGGGGSAEVEKAVAWAQRGYIAVAPDLPGIGEPKKIAESKGRWSTMKYGEGRYTANPDANASLLVDAVLSGMQSLYLLRAQPQVDTARIGVVGISWGGYMTTMVCGLAGDQVQAGFSVYGCGMYELTSQNPTLQKLPEAERAAWLKWLDAGRRASGIKAPFFIAAATNDFFFWPRAVQSTLEVIPGTRNQVYAPNANHRIPLPGGSIFQTKRQEPFTPTPFQPVPTPTGNKANWLEMEVPFFDYYLKGQGEPFPVVKQEPLDPKNAGLLRCQVICPRPIKKVEAYWAPHGPDWTKRVWQAVPATAKGDGQYEAKLPAEALAGAACFFVVTDDRPVTVSGDLLLLGADQP